MYIRYRDGFWVVLGLCLIVMVGCGGGEQPKVFDQQVEKKVDVETKKEPETKEETEAETKKSEEKSAEEKTKEALSTLLPLFVKIEPGTFQMGSPAEGPDKAERGSDERQHDVTISKVFWIASYEVTQDLYYAVMKTNPSHFHEAKHCSGNHIVYTDLATKKWTQS